MSSTTEQNETSKKKKFVRTFSSGFYCQCSCFHCDPESIPDSPGSLPMQVSGPIMGNLGPAHSLIWHISWVYLFPKSTALEARLVSTDGILIIYSDTSMEF